MTNNAVDYGQTDMPPIDSAKTLRDQVTEIEKIISDAQQQLTQASYALETLKDRIDALYAAPHR